MLGRGWACDRGFAVFCKNRREGVHYAAFDLNRDVGMHGVG